MEARYRRGTLLTRIGVTASCFACHSCALCAAIRGWWRGTSSMSVLSPSTTCLGTTLPSTPCGVCTIHWKKWGGEFNDRYMGNEHIKKRAMEQFQNRIFLTLKSAKKRKDNFLLIWSGFNEQEDFVQLALQGVLCIV